ncbi:hypothetical protein [Methanocaldococcus jannaschii]|nr:hypothetical protein [Methanocaldococcus jannaschii]
MLTFLTVGIGAIFTPQTYPIMPTIGFIVVAGIVSLIGMTIGALIIHQQYETLPANEKLEFKQKLLPEAYYICIELFGYGSLVLLYNTFTSNNPTLCVMSLLMAGLFILVVLVIWYFGYKSY